MDRECLKARLLRALSGKSQEETAAALGVHPSLVSQFETGKVVPSLGEMEALARTARITADGAEQLMQRYETLRRPRRRSGRSYDDILAELLREVEANFRATCDRLSRLAEEKKIPRAEDREVVDQLFERLIEQPQRLWKKVVELSDSCHSWAFCERACQAARAALAQGDLDRAALLVDLGRESAENASGPESWRTRLQGYAKACEAEVLHARGEAEAAEVAGAEARRLWDLGADPEGLLAAPALLGAL